VQLQRLATAPHCRGTNKQRIDLQQAPRQIPGGFLDCFGEHVQSRAAVVEEILGRKKPGGTSPKLHRKLELLQCSHFPICFFLAHGSVHHNSVLIKTQLDATVCKYLFTEKSLYMFRVSQHPSSGVLKLSPQPPVQVIITVQLLHSNVARSGRWREVAVSIL